MRRGLLAVLLVAAGIVAGAIAFRSPSSPTPGQGPGASLEPEVVRPTVGTITSVVVLDGVIRAAAPTQVTADDPGTIEDILVKAGDSVGPRQVLLRILATSGKQVEVSVPQGGVVVSMGVQVHQLVAVGDALLIVAPTTYFAEAVVPPEVLYRLYEPPMSMQAQVDHGPAPFDCPFAKIGAETDGGNPLDAPVYISCRVPDGTRVFSGIRTRLVVTTGKAEGVLTVPVEAVSGNADSGLVWVVNAAGDTEARPVQLGLTDGIRIEIVAGLSADERILDVPPSDAATPQ